MSRIIRKLLVNKTSSPMGTSLEYELRLFSRSTMPADSDYMMEGFHAAKARQQLCNAVFEEFKPELIAALRAIENNQPAIAIVNIESVLTEMFSLDNDEYITNNKRRSQNDNKS